MRVGGELQEPFVSLLDVLAVELVVGPELPAPHGLEVRLHLCYGVYSHFDVHAHEAEQKQQLLGRPAPSRKMKNDALRRPK